MPHKDSSQATRKARRTVIEDLPTLAEELSDEEASRAAGGEWTQIKCFPSGGELVCGSADVATEMNTNTCTGGSFLGLRTYDQDADQGDD
jgi:hypothetical protein